MKPGQQEIARPAAGDESLPKRGGINWRQINAACTKALEKRGALILCVICKKREAAMSTRRRCNQCRKAGL